MWELTLHGSVRWKGSFLAVCALLSFCQMIEGCPVVAKPEGVQSRSPQPGAAKQNRSRLLDMALTRGQQTERLYDKFALKQPSAKDDLLSLGSINDLPLSSGPSAKSLTALTAELQKRKKQFGEDHPYTIEAAMDICLKMEGANQNSDSIALAASKQWGRFCRRMLNYSAKGKKQPDKEMDNLVKLSGFSTLCQWTHNSGEIFAMILWGHGHNQDAHALTEQIPGIDVLGTASEASVHRLLTLARLLSSQNEYAAAKQMISAAKSMTATLRENAVTNKQRCLSMCLLEESVLSAVQSDFTAAAQLAGRARESLDQSGDIKTERGSALKANVLEQLARSLAMTPAKIGEAVKAEEECLSIRQKRFGRDGIFSVSTELELARLLRRKLSAERTGAAVKPEAPEVRRVKDLLTEVVNSCRKTEQTDSEVLRADRNLSLLLPRAYAELGNLAGICGNFKEARANLSKAFELDQSFSEPAFIPNRVADLDALASLDVHDQKLDSAREKVLKASTLLNSYVAGVLPQLSLAEQIAFSQNIETHMNSLLSVCRDDASLVGPYSELMRWKGFLIEQFRLRSLAIKRGDSQLNTLVASHQKLSDQILNDFVQSAQTGAAADQQHAQARKEELERQINARARVQAKPVNINLKQLQASLAPDKALIDLYEFTSWEQQPRYGAIVSFASGLRWVDLGPAAVVNQAISSWRNDQLDDVLPSKQVKVTSEPAAWLQLRKLLSLPLARVIPATVNRLWISDESQLARLPWSVLLSEFGGTKTYDVCQIDSPRELLSLIRDRPVSARKQMLLVGGIDYSKHVPPAPQLAQAESEVKLIQKEATANGLKCTVLSDLRSVSPTRAIRKNVMDSLSNCLYGHLVTHGFFNNTEEADVPDDAAGGTDVLARNPLIESGLLISKPQGKSNDNGLLTAEDLLDTDLDGCRLLTLSACETGRGREINSQGVIGLRSALMGAGARSVLLSLWPVSDRATSQLMTVFYQNLFKGKSPSEALRQAQASIRSQEQWRAPRYWAAWVMIGDGWGFSSGMEK